LVGPKIKARWSTFWAYIAYNVDHLMAVGYLSKRRALKALGLSEQSLAPDSS
jgi:hypothetical protein